jgi:uncharacterized protein (TIGR03435 family)
MDFDTPVLFALLTASLGCAQPLFEVASIKPVASLPAEGAEQRPIFIRVEFGPNRFLASNCTVQMLLEMAYGVDDHQISGAPEWVNAARYDVEAKIDSGSVDALRKLDGEQRMLAHRHMLQGLLADRFMLALHRETRELPIYAVVIAKSGSKLSAAIAGETYASGAKTTAGTPFGPHTVGFKSSVDSDQAQTVELTGQGVSVDALVNRVKIYLSRKIVDDTGLKGEYDFKVTFRRPMNARPVDVQETVASGADIFTAFQQQLGLKLEARKGPAEVIVVDRVERPSAN